MTETERDIRGGPVKDIPSNRSAVNQEIPVVFMSCSGE